MTTHHTALALACLACLSGNSLAAEYVGSDVPGLPGTPGSDGRVPTPTDNLGRIPRDAYQPPRTGIPYSGLFRDTGAPYYNALRDVRVDPTARAGESVTFSGAVDAPDFRGRFPLLQRGFAPENADLKIGPLYFKLRHISAAALYSDNVFRDDSRKEAETLAVFSIGGQIMAQLTEGFHIAIAGNLVWLPFESDFGPDGFGLVAPYSFGLAGAPYAQAQVAWEPVFFGRQFVIADEFRMGLARFSNDSYDAFELFENADTDSVDNAGIYTLRAPTFRQFNDPDRDRDPQNDVEFIYYSNEISLSTGGPFFGESIFRFRASHEDIWYEEEGQDLPRQRDRVFFGVQSVRESLRFKPFANYEYIRTVDPDRSVHEVNAGIRGPITDLMLFEGSLGYFWDDERDNSSLLWRLALYHTPDSRTRHSLVYSRNISEFLDEQREHLTYQIRRTLGPNLTGGLYASYNWIEDLDHLVSDRTELRSGVTLNYVGSPRTSYRVTGQYISVDYDDDFGSYDAWIGRFELRHRFLESLYARFVYQYENRRGEGFSPDITENLAYLSLSWLFE